MGQDGLNSVSVCLSSTQTSKNIAPSLAMNQQLSPCGFTLVELLISVAIVATLAAIAVPLTQDYLNRGNVARAAVEIRGLEKEIIYYKTEIGRYPCAVDPWTSLMEIGRENFLDPWGTSYKYRNLEDGPKAGDKKPQFCRRDRSFNPLNDDFDLYSVGPDRRVPTNYQITKGTGADDIVRAGNGQYVGEGSKY
jgi:general secretion pathway protein G